MMKVYYQRPPVEIENDENYLWHGTSNIYESAFEDDNNLSLSIFTLNDLKLIINIYNQMNWCGEHSGGFAVLNSFSVSDYANESTKYFFLGETFQRVLIYASEDFAGGEMLRSVYYALKDLFAYFDSAEIQNKHMEYIAKENEFVYPKLVINLNGVANKLNSLRSTFQSVENIFKSFKYGIVYGFKINFSEYSKLTYREGMGIIAPLKPPININTVKVIVKNEDINFNFDHKRRDRMIMWKDKLKSP